MFAFLAAVVFFLGLIHVTLGTVSLVYLGWFLIALHLFFPVGVPGVPQRKN